MNGFRAMHTRDWSICAIWFLKLGDGRQVFIYYNLPFLAGCNILSNSQFLIEK